MELFYFPECPFCHKVRVYMAEHDIDLPLLDAHDPDNEEQLIKRGGKLQVPALLHDDKILYESDAIIDYLDSLQ